MKVGKKIGIGATVFICGVLSILAIIAWIIHFEWQRTGAYSENSFPMNKLASDLTTIAVLSMLISWRIWWWVKKSYSDKISNR